MPNYRLTLPISYRYDLEPAPSPAPLIICLHGYGQNGEMALSFGKHIGLPWPVAALQAPHPHHKMVNGAFGTGFSWVSAYKPEEDVENHHRFLLHVMEHAYNEGLTPEPKCFLFGFSQSVSLNYRFALRYPERIMGVIAVAGATPSDLPPPREAGESFTMPVLHIAPTGDEAYPADKVEGFKAQLKARAPHLTLLEPDGGHRVPRETYPLMRDWLLRVQAGRLEGVAATL